MLPFSLSPGRELTQALLQTPPSYELRPIHDWTHKKKTTKEIRKKERTGCERRITPTKIAPQKMRTCTTVNHTEGKLAKSALNVLCVHVIESVYATARRTVASYRVPHKPYGRMLGWPFGGKGQSRFFPKPEESFHPMGRGCGDLCFR